MEEIQKAVKTCLSKYADFNGRAARPEFWWFILAQVVVSLVLSMVAPVLGWLFSLAMIVPTVAAGSRRLHDIGKSGWLQLVGFIPLIGWILLVYWAAQPGEARSNQYGLTPQDAELPATVMPGEQ
ncbi:DUF805 domain-containing protein [uncultured Ramlibacter sp.]|uniref:DUF805 domain-containing protein n=1 Tax=uncultured Ramlibacter sp. TaxID=260755 RepID=UPI002633FB34|nr:DUF805 domain-containing protein [uncultured Ramlibacter sp.]